MCWLYRNHLQLNAAGVVALERGRHGRAKRLFVKAIGRAPSEAHGQLRFNLGLVELAAGERDVGLAHMASAAEAGVPEAVQFLRQVRREQRVGLFASAQRFVEEAVERMTGMAEKALGVDAELLRRARQAAGLAGGAGRAAKGVVAVGAASTTATSLTVAATSGAGITSGLAAAGFGGGMAAGPAVLAGGPAILTAAVLNATVLRDSDDLTERESAARRAARWGTNVGAAAGLSGVGIVTVAGGASGPAIMSTLAGVGAGSALTGVGMLVVAPAVVAAGAGYGIYWLWGGGTEVKEFEPQHLE